MENIRMNLHLFDANTQVTTQQSLTEEMKTFYSDYLIDAAEPELVHDQFAQKHPIPANGGKTIQFRRFAPLGKALTALTEGVTPDGQSLSMSTVEAAVRQYGGYIQMSDLLLLTAIDNNLTMATKLLGAQAGRTLDTITREVLVGGDNVQYADESVSARYLLRGGNAGAADNNYLTVDCIRRAVRALKNANCRRIDGAFPVIIHPDVAYDLMNDPKWLAPHQYVDTEHMYEGEIGKIEGCRFVESTEAKIFHAEDLPRRGSGSRQPHAARKRRGKRQDHRRVRRRHGQARRARRPSGAHRQCLRDRQGKHRELHDRRRPGHGRGQRHPLSRRGRCAGTRRVRHARARRGRLRHDRDHRRRA